MRILSIETSCDETALSIIDAEGGLEAPSFSVLGNALYSQAKTHAEYGGVFPALAKREHARTILPLLKMTLEGAYVNGLQEKSTFDGTTSLTDEKINLIREALEREGHLVDEFTHFFETVSAPYLDAIAVTHGPGLEPALWVGINVARALGIAWDIPVIPVNHMEGHIVSVLASQTDNMIDASSATEPEPVAFPALALLISGGHTELVQIDNWHQYKVIGRTRDDAVGEAFDKVARILGLPYPGGPQISRLAALYREKMKKEQESKEMFVEIKNPFTLPRPMITSPDYDFSFSGLKTAVLYAAKNATSDNTIPLTDNQKHALAAEFEDAATEVLVSKTARAIEETGAQTLIIGGGVVANTYIRAQFKKLIFDRFPYVSLRVPSVDLSTDNSVMIAMAGYIHACAEPDVLMNTSHEPIQARGNLSFELR